jgi:hypothetical protein
MDSDCHLNMVTCLLNCHTYSAGGRPVRTYGRASVQKVPDCTELIMMTCCPSTREYIASPDAMSVKVCCGIGRECM